MVQAILDGRKTVTRRALNPQPQKNEIGVLCWKDCYWMNGIIGLHSRNIEDYAPYKPGDIMYVRETWARYHEFYIYKTACQDTELLLNIPGATIHWHPSIHMPKKAARIFLRVTDVRVERLQDITEEQALLEGAINNNEYAAPLHTVRDDFKSIWEETIKPENRVLYGWAANPWVWVIEFERIRKYEDTKC